MEIIKELSESLKKQGLQLLETASKWSRRKWACGAGSVITMLIITPAAWGNTNDRGGQTGRLLAPASVTLYYEGREVGKATLPPGTPVRIHRMGETTALVEAGAGTAQVPIENIEVTGEELAFEKERDRQALIEVMKRPRCGERFPRQAPPKGPKVPDIPKGDENVPSSNPGFEKQVLELTNQFRSQHGLPPLRWDENLARVARFHSAHMAQNRYLDHHTLSRGSNGKIAMTWNKRMAVFKTGAVAENIAAGQPTPSEVMNSWITSPGHRENLLNRRATRMGVGYVADHWTQVMGG